jgi:hypothetical protein
MPLGQEGGLGVNRVSAVAVAHSPAGKVRRGIPFCTFVVAESAKPSSSPRATDSWPSGFPPAGAASPTESSSLALVWEAPLPSHSSVHHTQP